MGVDFFRQRGDFYAKIFGECYKVFFGSIRVAICRTTSEFRPHEPYELVTRICVLKSPNPKKDQGPNWVDLVQ